jgi:hypothetical protein
MKHGGQAKALTIDSNRPSSGGEDKLVRVIDFIENRRSDSSKEVKTSSPYNETFALGSCDNNAKIWSM